MSEILCELLAFLCVCMCVCVCVCVHAHVHKCMCECGVCFLTNLVYGHGREFCALIYSTAYSSRLRGDIR